MKKHFLTFYDYWRNFGSLEDIVIKQPKNLETTFYIFGLKVWQEANGGNEKAYDDGHSDGFDLGEKEERIRVLKILSEQNKLTP